MSDSGAAGWRRWNMDRLDAGRRPETGRPPRPDERRDRERRQRAELESLREQARESAREEGHAAGFEAGREEGYTRGLEQGREAADRETRRRQQEILAPLASLAMQFREALQRLDDDVADEIVELAMTIGRQLAGDAMQADPGQVAALVRELLHEELPLGDQLRLYLHPADLTLVRRELGRELETAGWTLQADERLERGGCRVAGPGGELDATRESRWRLLAERVRNGAVRRAVDRTVDNTGDSAA